jgi:hypothetical protein
MEIKGTRVFCRFKKKKKDPLDVVPCALHTTNRGGWLAEDIVCERERHTHITRRTKVLSDTKGKKMEEFIFF